MQVTPRLEFIPERIVVPGKPLGRKWRLVNWRELHAELPEPEPYVPEPVAHEPANDAPLDQGELGKCGGESTEQCKLCAPFTLSGPVDMPAAEAEGTAIYSLATTLDPFPGSYPPTDTGTSGSAAMRAAVQMGIFSGFAMTDSVYAACMALEARPGTFGVDWYEGYDSPDQFGRIHPTGELRGGHLICGCRIAPDPGASADDIASGKAEMGVYLRNTWNRWGVQVNGKWGYCWISLRRLGLALYSGGDAQFPAVP